MTSRMRRVVGSITEIAPSLPRTYAIALAEEKATATGDEESAINVGFAFRPASMNVAVFASLLVTARVCPSALKERSCSPAGIGMRDVTRSPPASICASVVAAATHTELLDGW